MNLNKSEKKPLVVLELELVLKRCIPVTCLPMNYADYDSLAMAIVLELAGKAALVDVNEYRQVTDRLARYELLGDAIRAIQADK